MSFIQNVCLCVEWFALIEHLFQLSDLSFQVTCTLLHIPGLHFFSCKPCKLGIPPCLLCNMRFIRLIFVFAMTSCFIYNRNAESYLLRSYSFLWNVCFLTLVSIYSHLPMKLTLGCLMDIYHMMSCCIGVESICLLLLHMKCMFCLHFMAFFLLISFLA